MTKITIASVPSVKDYVSKKNGRPYKKIYFKAQEYGADVISGFYRQEMSNWKRGDVVEVESISTGSVSKDGQTTFRDFVMPDKDSTVLDKKLEQVLNYLVGIKIDIANLREEMNTPKNPRAQAKYPTAEDEGINLDEVFPEPSPEELNATLND